MTSIAVTFQYEKEITLSGLCCLVSSVNFITINCIFGPLELSFEIHFLLLGV